jgi:multidrug resistance efflux pump
MNSPETTAETPESEAPDAVEQESAEKTVKKGGRLVASFIILTLSWYLLADRYTPYTDQARVRGYVVGVAPQVAGIVLDVWVVNNQKVEKGDRLFRIDPSNYEIALAKSRSDLENARRQVDAGDAAVEAARANLRAAQANQVKAEQDTVRLTRLRKEDPGTISTRRVEVSSATLDQAIASVAAAESNIQQAIEQKGGDDGDNSQIKVAQAAVEKAELDLERTVVKASSRGVITDLRADVGHYSAAGSPVLTLVALSDVWVRAEFTENNLGRIRIGTSVDILVDVMPGQVFKGEITSIGLGVSTSQAPVPGTLPTIDNNRDWLRQSQRFPVNIKIDPSQQKELFGQLRIGGQVSVMAYSEGSGPLVWLGKIYIRLMSVFSYAY